MPVETTMTNLLYSSLFTFGGRFDGTCYRTSPFPLRSRIADKVSDSLFCIDEAAAMISAEHSPAAFRELEERIRAVYDEIDGILKELVD